MIRCVVQAASAGQFAAARDLTGSLDARRLQSALDVRSSDIDRQLSVVQRHRLVHQQTYPSAMSLASPSLILCWDISRTSVPGFATTR